MHLVLSPGHDVRGLNVGVSHNGDAKQALKIAGPPDVRAPFAGRGHWCILGLPSPKVMGCGGHASGRIWYRNGRLTYRVTIEGVQS